MATFRLPTKHYRALPSPNGTSRLGVFFVPATSVSRDLWDWRDVNPREVNKRSSVYKSICLTLTQEPERFHERNRGVTIVAQSILYDDKRQEVIITLADNKLHGVVDGAHTLSAVLESQLLQEGSYWPAHVFFKVVEGLDPEQIAEIAGGLNTSQQVDLKSLENLKAHFDELRSALRNEPYADKIAYKMNEDLPIDVREVLYYLAVLDAETYDDKLHPVALFGRKEGIVRRFAEQAKDPNSGNSFRILISKAPEILRLRDMIEKKAIAVPNIGRYNAGKGVRVRSESNRETPLYFLNENCNGRIPMGWIMPMLAAFRANINWDRPKGTFSWIVPLEELLDSCIEQLVLGIKDVHEQENSRPEYVGRNSIAWRMSYSTVSEYILKKRLASLDSAQ